MTDWSALVRPSLIGVEPYRPGPSVDELKERHGLAELAKLNWNEGLLGPFPGVREAVVEELERAWMYPEHAYTSFREAIAESLGARPELIVPGHGIQALIATVAHAFLDPGATVVVPSPTYGLYGQVSAAAGAQVVVVPGKDHRHDLDALAETAARTGARLAWLCDPNNPTGALVSREEWEAFLGAMPSGCAVIVDEAYADYVQPALRLHRETDVADGRPVVILRTFSKIYGLAGLRLGYAIVHETLAPYLDVVQEPFNVNRAALAAGCASLRDPNVLVERRQENEATRERLAELLRVRGLQPFPSHANFLLVRIGMDDRAVAEALLARGLLIRPGHDFGMPGYIRVTIGPVGLMERLAEELAAVVAEAVDEQLEGASKA
jgi:histidinol-phosphate aminotransferase